MSDDENFDFKTRYEHFVAGLKQNRGKPLTDKVTGNVIAPDVLLAEQGELLRYCVKHSSRDPSLFGSSVITHLADAAFKVHDAQGKNLMRQMLDDPDSNFRSIQDILQRATAEQILDTATYIYKSSPGEIGRVEDILQGFAAAVESGKLNDDPIKIAGDMGKFAAMIEPTRNGASLSDLFSLICKSATPILNKAIRSDAADRERRFFEKNEGEKSIFDNFIDLAIKNVKPELPGQVYPSQIYINNLCKLINLAPQEEAEKALQRVSDFEYNGRRERKQIRGALEERIAELKIDGGESVGESGDGMWRKLAAKVKGWKQER